jgi:hypothetical protein
VGRDYDVLLTPTMACRPPLVDTVLREAVGNPGGFRLTENQIRLASVLEPLAGWTDRHAAAV